MSLKNKRGEDLYDVLRHRVAAEIEALNEHGRDTQCACAGSHRGVISLAEFIQREFYPRRAPLRKKKVTT